MLEEENNHNNKSEPNKIIDVTKPQQTPGGIDTSKVSDYTLQEQQSLERLKNKVGKVKQRDNRGSNFKTIVAIILAIILILIAILFVIFISRKETPQEEKYDMRLSMQIENKSALSIITEAGQEQLREINPGDKIALRASVRNSFDIGGDVIEEGSTPPSIYIRFKLVLILDYKERYDIMIPTMSNRWLKYNAEIENSLPNGTFEDDHYYYYLGSLAFMEPEELFSEIEFSGDAITCDDGGKYGQIQVQVEAIEANIGNIVSKAIWSTAPQEWVNKMVDMWTGNGA
ncbi:MAG: hypothetical protein ACI4PF_00165 [Christensenellales bacterium]